MTFVVGISRGCKQVDDDSFFSIGNGKYLNYIEIIGCKKVTAEVMKKLKLKKHNKIVIKC